MQHFHHVVRRIIDGLLPRVLPLALPLLAVHQAAAQIDLVEQSATPQPNPQSQEVFGRVIDFDGDTLAAGSPYYDVTQADDGAAYVWEWGPAGPGAMTMFTSPSASNQAHFGSAVAIDDDTLVVGEEHSDLFVNSGGAVHVYVRQAGVWTLQQTLTLASPAYFDEFGASVDLEGDRLVVGGPSHGTNRTGGAWVFDRVGTQWSQTGYLVATDLLWGDEFGRDVAVSGDTVLVGVPAHGGGGIDEGAAYVFREVGGIWSQERKLEPSPGTLSGHFGISVDLEGDLALIGATNTNDPGAAYAFTRSGSAWSLEMILTAWSGATHATFGDSVALDGERAVIGAWQDSAPSFGEGSAYVFDRDGGAWTGVARLIRSTPAISRFGRGTAISGDTVFAGATIASPSGVIYEYEITASLGSNYCTAELNSIGEPGVIYAHGSDLASDNEVVLYAGRLPDNKFGYFLAGQGTGDLFPLPGSQGRVCLGGAPIARYNGQILNTGAFGWFATAVDVHAIPLSPPVTVVAGETWNFQAWYRDNNPGVTSNFTDAVSITFL
ncbi:MAG: hypothetical protein GY711_05735 [bacterium]|nr:hypothetical protein [bacterium]